MIEFAAHYSSSQGNLYQIFDSGTSLLLECGVPIQKIKKALNFKLSNINGCLATHFHADHSGYIKDVLRVGIDTYISKSIIDHYGLSGHHRIHGIHHKQQFQIGTLTILALEVPHDVPCLSFLIASDKDKFLFAIDCLYFPYLIPGLTHIGIGINYQTDILKKNIENGSLHPALAQRIMQSHLSLETALSFFKAQNLSKVKEIHVLHCSSKNADKGQIKEAVQRTTGKLVII